MLKTLVDCSLPGWQLKGSDSKCWQRDLPASVSATDERSGSGRGGGGGGPARQCGCLVCIGGEKGNQSTCRGAIVLLSSSFYMQTCRASVLSKSGAVRFAPLGREGPAVWFALHCPVRAAPPAAAAGCW